MAIKFLRQKTLDELYSNVESNLDRYRAGNFDDLLLTDKIYTFDKIDIDHDALDNIEGGDKNDAINCLRLFNAIDGMTPYLARDARIWCYLTHTYLLEYSRNRWPIPADDDDAIKKIVSHFFTSNQDRSFQRDNAASRLWWPAFVCNKVKGFPLEKSLELLFYRQDVRQNLLDRSSSARIENLFSVIVNKLNASFETEERPFFDREKNRSYMKEVNFLGGSTVMEALTFEDSSKILKEVDESIFEEEIPVGPAEAETGLEPVPEEGAAVEEIPITSEAELRTILEAKRDEIARAFPNTPDERRLLTPTMIAGLMYQKPRDMEDFISFFPLYIRNPISGEEAERFLSEILKIIDENT
jgi:hypothetical protein